MNMKQPITKQMKHEQKDRAVYVTPLIEMFSMAESTQFETSGGGDGVAAQAHS